MTAPALSARRRQPVRRYLCQPPGQLPGPGYPHGDPGRAGQHRTREGPRDHQPEAERENQTTAAQSTASSPRLCCSSRSLIQPFAALRREAVDCLPLRLDANAAHDHGFR